jgi:hypothetical protein
MSESLTFRANSLNDEAVEAVKLRTALSASYSELTSILGDIKFVEMLWNFSQFVNFSTDSERFLVLTWSNIWNNVGGWSE